MHRKEGRIASSQTSTLPSLTEKIAVSTIRDFFRDSPLVVFGTGMSCALDPRFGMPALERELSRKVVPDINAHEQVQQWSQVMESLQNNCGLETALDNVTDSALLQKITRATGEFVSSIDKEYAIQISNGDAVWPATAFFKLLVDKLPEGDPVLHVLTPNYDTLFEHACDTVDIHYTSGFFGGLQRQLDWEAVERSLLVLQRVAYGRQLKAVFKPRKHVRLYKVHGSLNYFLHRGSIVENNAWMWDAPCYATRVMIAPGVSKYQTLQNYRQELLKTADAAIDKATRFLFLGYGFNDTHLEAYINKKLTTQGCKGLIVTKDSNPRIESLLSQAENLWLVCGPSDDVGDGARIFNKRYDGWLELPTKRLWDVDTFNSEVLGGK